MNEYSWSIASAVYQIQNGLAGPASDSAHAWLQDKIENGCASEVTDIAGRLFDAVAALSAKEEK